MKRIVLLLVFSAGLLSVNGQTLGVKMSPSLTLINQSDNVGFGFFGGLYYNQNVYKRIGVSSGLFFTQFRAVKTPVFCLQCVGCPCPDRIDYRLDVLEIPFHMTIDCSMRTDSRWRFLLKSGYSFGKIIGRYSIVYDEGQKMSKGNTRFQGLDFPICFFTYGFEIRHAFSNKLNLAFGGQYKFAVIEDGYFGGTGNFALFVKTGYSFRKVNKMQTPSAGI